MIAVANADEGVKGGGAVQSEARDGGLPPDLAMVERPWVSCRRGNNQEFSLGTFGRGWVALPLLLAAVCAAVLAWRAGLPAAVALLLQVPLFLLIVPRLRLAALRSRLVRGLRRGSPKVPIGQRTR